jgi:hypothetical protein
MQAMYAALRALAALSHVMLPGREMAAAKELVPKLYMPKRAARQFRLWVVNCGAIPSPCLYVNFSVIAKARIPA